MAISNYLYEVRKEAQIRGYHFDGSKIDLKVNPQGIQTTRGQLDFEKRHLLSKLKQRSLEGYNVLMYLEELDPHPLFRIIPGEIEDWEKGNN